MGLARTARQPWKLKGDKTQIGKGEPSLEYPSVLDVWLTKEIGGRQMRHQLLCLHLTEVVRWGKARFPKERLPWVALQLKEGGTAYCNPQEQGPGVCTAFAQRVARDLDPPGPCTGKELALEWAPEDWKPGDKPPRGYRR